MTRQTARGRLATICARGGSKGIPGKNLRPIAGLPLITHSVRHALDSGLFEFVAVSSDSPEILDAARAAGAQLHIVRPDELAGDHAGKLPAIQHAAREAERMTGRHFDTFVDLCATSPLRNIDDIRACVAAVEQGEARNVITVTPAHRSPYFNLVEVDAAGRVALAKKPVTPILRRQDAPACYDMNASIYAWRREPFIDTPYLFAEDTAIHIMPRERSFDIDSPLDFEIVEMIMKKRLAG